MDQKEISLRPALKPERQEPQVLPIEWVQISSQNDLPTLRVALGVFCRWLRGEGGRPASRELSLAVTALEDADNWIARHMGLLEIKD